MSANCHHCGQPQPAHPVSCFGCQTCEFRCDHYICMAYKPPLVDLWLDDERDPANFSCQGYVWIKTAEALIAWFEEHGMDAVNNVSLDHDLGSGRMTGYDAITWMENEVALGKAPPRRIALHTQNPVGMERMRAVRFKIYQIYGESR